MAIDKLTFFQQGAAAGIQGEEYTSNPGMVDSSNLDVFSSSQCVKAMPRSNPKKVEGDWVDKDINERFFLATDGRVWDSLNDVWYDHSYFDDNAEDINYNDGSGTAKATFGTPKKLFVAYGSDGEWKTISILTDKLIYNIYSNWVHCEPYNSWKPDSEWAVNIENGIIKPELKWSGVNNKRYYIGIKPYNENGGRYKINYNIVSGGEMWELTFRNSKYNVEWSKSKGVFERGTATTILTKTILPTDEQEGDIETFMSTFDGYSDYTRSISVELFAKGSSSSGSITILTKFYKKEDWQYLYPRDRRVTETDDEVYVSGNDESNYWQLSQYALEDESGIPYYQLQEENAFDMPDDVTLVAFAKGLNYQYIFGNKKSGIQKGNIGMVYYSNDGSIASFDSNRRFPGITFINAVMVDTYAYVIAEERGVRGLYMFYNGELKRILHSNLDNGLVCNIEPHERFNFDNHLCVWRGRVVACTGSKVLMRGPNKDDQNVGCFVYETEGVITNLSTKYDRLEVTYELNGESYTQVIEDSKKFKHYNTDFSITYPLQIGSHLIEKEPLDLQVSYMLPNNDCKLDVWLNVNDYHFWTFKVEDDVEFEGEYTLAGVGGEYSLEYVESFEKWHTFVLKGNLGHNESDEWYIVQGEQKIAYSDFHHFKHIATFDEPTFIQGESRSIELKYINDLPRVRKLQLRIDGTTDGKVTPKIYGVQLLSTQLER